jgi:hypothetical protein
MSISANNSCHLHPSPHACHQLGILLVILGLQLGDLDAHEQGRKAEDKRKMWITTSLLDRRVKSQRLGFQFEATELTLDEDRGRWFLIQHLPMEPMCASMEGHPNTL